MSRPRKHALQSSALVTPPKERRRSRLVRQRAAEQIRANAALGLRAAARAKADAERAEARAVSYLPRSGEPGPAELRSWRKLRVPTHQDTSAALAGAYPFLAEAGLGSEGVFIGQDMYSSGSFVYDPWVLYQRGLITAPNVVLAGIVGSGKSALAKSLYTRSIPFGRRVYVVADPKGEHTQIAEAVGGRAIRLGHGLPARLNPLDAGYRAAGLSDAEWQTQLSARRRDLVGALAETVLDRPLTPVEHTAVDIALRVTVASSPAYGAGRRNRGRTRPAAPDRDRHLRTPQRTRRPRTCAAGRHRHRNCANRRHLSEYGARSGGRARRAGGIRARRCGGTVHLGNHQRIRASRLRASTG